MKSRSLGIILLGLLLCSGARAGDPPAISKGGLVLEMFEPFSPSYQGTRFDRSGLFKSLRWNGVEMTDVWYDTSRGPTANDAVQGPAEEFMVYGYENAPVGGTFLKIGVGLLLKEDDSPYNRFHRYRIVDPGEWKVEEIPSGIRFTQTLPTLVYTKEVVLTSESTFSIRHTLKNTSSGKIGADAYIHNFFTLGLLSVGPTRKMDLPYPPAGYWRSDYDSVRETAEGYRFLRELRGSEWIQMNCIRQALQGDLPYEFTVREEKTGLGVRASSATRAFSAVFWSNARISCFEPYVLLSIDPGKTFSWDVDYELLSFPRR